MSRKTKRISPALLTAVTLLLVAMMVITCSCDTVTLSNDDASYTISSDRIEPTAGSVCFTVTLKYTISSADDFVLNEGTISMASIG